MSRPAQRRLDKLRRPLICTYQPSQIPLSWLTSGDFALYLDILKQVHPEFTYVKPELWYEEYIKNYGRVLRSTDAQSIAKIDRAKIIKANTETVQADLLRIPENDRQLAMICGSGSHHSLMYFYGRHKYAQYTNSICNAMPTHQLDMHFGVCQKVLNTNFQWDTNDYDYEQVASSVQYLGGTCGF